MYSFLVHLSLHPVLLARYFVFPLSRLLFIQELTTILIFPFVILRFLSYPCIIHPFFKAFVCLPVIQKDRDMPSFSLSRKCLKPISKRPSLSWHQFAEEPAENILLVLLKGFCHTISENMWRNHSNSRPWWRYCCWRYGTCSSWSLTV